MMYKGKMYLFARLSIAVFCAVLAVYAQDAGKGAASAAAPAAPAKASAQAAAAQAAQTKTIVKDVEVRSGSRGMILIINGSRPMFLGGKSVDFEKTTVKYKDFSVNIADAAYAAGATATFNPPPELPIKSVTLTNVASGLSMSIKMRAMVAGPVDVRNSDNQIRILLTRSPLPEIIWSSERGVVSAPPPGAAPQPSAASKAAGAPAKGDAVAPPPQKQPAGALKVASKTETPAAHPQGPSAEVTKKSPEGELVKYKVFGRDPFVPLLRDTSTTALPSVENLRLVGVLEDARERIALVEDFKNGNRAFALRTNDPVAQGKVLRVHRDKVVFLIRDFEVSHSYTLGLSTTETK